MAVAILLVACGNDDAKEEETTPVSKEEATEQVEETEKAEEKEPIDVTMDVEPVIDNGKVYFIGETNIPDRGVLMFTVTGPNDYMAQTKEIILDGEFQTDPFSAQGETLPAGEYELSVSLSIPSAQDEEEFIEAAGEDYEYLTGELMDESDLGKSMEYETTFTIE